MAKANRLEFFSDVPEHFWHNEQSQALAYQLTKFDPSLTSNPEKFGFVHGMAVAHNFAVATVESDPFRALRAEKLHTLGESVLGMIPCYDGRNVPMLQGGRELSYHPAAGGLIETDTYDEKHFPRSANLREGIGSTAVLPSHHLTEIVAGHAPGIDEKKPPESADAYGPNCGKMELEEKEGRLEPGETLVAANLRMQANTIEAVTNQYNYFRTEAGFHPLDQVGIAMTFDTYRRGLIIGADKPIDSPLRYSTTRATETHASRIEAVVGKEAGGFGSMADTYTHLNMLLEESTRRFQVTKSLLRHPELKGYRDDIKDTLHTTHPSFTEKQLWGIMYFLAFTTSIQYLAGLADREKKPVNPHINHGELISVLSKVRNPFLLFPHIQTFSSNPPESSRYADHGRLQNSIMKAEGKHNPIFQNFGHVMFLPTPVDGKNFNTSALATAKADNGEGVRAIYQDELLMEEHREGRFSAYPMFTDQLTRAVLMIPNQRTYAFGI